MRSLNLDQLRALVVVAETRSFSAAARRLNLSQPAVSVQVRELERRFGVQLIERLGKQAHPTPAGRDLIAAAEGIFLACSKAEAALNRYRSGWIGQVRVASTNTALMYLLPPLLRGLSLDYPGLDLHVTNLPTRESVEAIRQNRVDLALVTLPIETTQLRITNLVKEEMVAIFSSGARDLPEVVTPKYVMHQSLLMEHVRAAVHDLVMSWLSTESGQPRVPMHLGTIEALKRATAANLGMTIIPRMAVNEMEKDIVVRPLRPALTRTLALIEHVSKPHERAYQIVREALLSIGEVSGAPIRRTGKRRRPKSGRPT